MIHSLNAVVPDITLNAILKCDFQPAETVGERLWGLTEMFPDVIRTTTASLADNTSTGIKHMYGFSRSLFWIVFSSSIILFAPVIFEVERAQLEEMQRNQQKQVNRLPKLQVM